MSGIIAVYALVVAVLMCEMIQDHDADNMAIIDEVSTTLARPTRSSISIGPCSSADEFDHARLPTN